MACGIVRSAAELGCSRNQLTWLGKTHKIKVQDSCAKYRWRAERKGEAFDFCTAIKGYAEFKEVSLIQCDQSR